MALEIIILAAGQGKRMRSKLPKILHPLAGRPLLAHVLDTARALAPRKIVVVHGNGAEQVRAAFADAQVEWALQAEQLGTGHAVQQALPAISLDAEVLILYADVPLVRPATLKRLLEAGRDGLAVMTAELGDPTGYGRIVRVGKDDRVARIVEHRDASPEELEIDEINTGIFCFRRSLLAPALRMVQADNAQGEFYLTDVVEVLAEAGHRVVSVVASDRDETHGINDRAQLAHAEDELRRRTNARWLAQGVTMVDPATTYIDPRAEIGADTVIHPGVVVEGPTRIGRACEIQAHVRITDAEIGDHVNINSFCVIVESRIENGASVGPFAHLRPASVVGERAKIGNFVELKKTSLGAGSKVSHLSYLGDATVGEHVNVGAGTITCNYDGEKKHQTIIEDGAFIGSDSQLVAPVRVGKGAYVAAGSSITQDVPDGSLGIARARQANVEGWVERKKTVSHKG